MDIRRVILATLLSALVLLGFDYFMPQPKPQPAVATQEHADTQASRPPPAAAPGSTAADEGAPARLPIDAVDVSGSVNLHGARLDDLVLRGYHETVKPGSPLVRVLEAQGQPHPTYVEFGWYGQPGQTVRLPDAHSVWKTDAQKLGSGAPVTLSWSNDAGLTFEIVLAIDRDYMFTVTQRVRNATGDQVALVPYSRVVRAYTPEETGGMLVHEGPISVINGRMEEGSYKSLRTNSTAPNFVSWSASGTGGWAGITDKYWLAAVVPDQKSDVSGTYGFDTPAGAYEVGFTGRAPVTVAANGVGESTAHVFAGAKEVRLLERYENELHIPDFWKAVDFGWFAFLTRPVFFVLDWLYQLFGNFGLALLTFTLIVKTLFFPLAAKGFRSAAAMRSVQPKMQAIRERYKSDPVQMNQKIMQLYKEEGVNPASGCLPLLIQAPVFWCLYKDLYVTIEMRHAPFFGWIHDLSAPDPTNLFNLFGLIPWDPTTLSGMLLLGVWPILYGATMFLMQKMNPATVDPAQKQIFMAMPFIFTFFMARQPVGLVIYYCWNNLLTVAQQMVIQRVHRDRPKTTVIPPAKKARKG
ncbi:translocase inner membrane component YidC [Acetobacter nitrogenifigens DSM 23921 = NBRC 105050]|uniref:Membrane protein insertase YidC n=1 Tax=Acetobacter nitrogenifigens DSM 23921 = NBRC 105050 TaxID=1120919 RepID=A0A511X717_9PROT|nr:membrane protein insertase YidC [Acetobacter nitrogenifigens]GBQ95178.1 translocase inner membrane component YidC [Acetobacter nitrogenifigens DSM 23921 = NBRC 105050]GEN58740.1 membrane protein insertase YidC [Acetobacter nitrogenifigens DSM 23921 = NBRC 105050]